MTDVQQEILQTLTTLRNDVVHLRQDMHRVIEYLEDTQLTEEEGVLVEKTLAKVKAGNVSDFMSHEQLKAELGV